MHKIRKHLNRFKNLFLILILATAQVVSATGPFIINNLQRASAAPICVNDSAGANDEPGQKDLTRLCVDYAGVPTTVSTTWNWDDLGTSGANTLDACNLFDTDGDGNINYAVCVTTTGTPAALQSVTTYSCGDAKIDRCTSTAAVISSGTTSCTVTQQSTDPFASGNDAPFDTQGACTIQLSTVGGASARLIDVCSYPSAQPNSDPSDCVIARNDFGKVELVKDLIPVSDTGLFNLTINGPEASDTTTVNNVGDGGTTGEVVVKKGTVVVSETPGTSTTLTGYTTTISCKDLNGTGAVIASGSPTGTSSRQLSFTLEEDADVVCTITNTRQTGTITLIKNVVNNNGGTAGVNEFGLSIGGEPVTSGQTKILTPGDYAINEAGLAGYSFVNIAGTGCPAQLGGSVSLTNGQNITCTITNDDQQAYIIVNKTVTNDNGGTADPDDFKLTIDGNAVLDEVKYAVNPGEHTAGETTLPGYTAGAWGGDCNTNAKVTVALGETKTCTITNDDDAPSLTLNKIISNLNGGTQPESAWTLYANGPASISGTGAAGSSDVVSDSGFSAGTYSLSESTGPVGYSASLWTCTNNVTVTAGKITLTNGQTTVCSITNSDVAPVLILLKKILNDNGGTYSAVDWILTAQHDSDAPIIDEKGTTSDGGQTAATNSAEAVAGLIYVLSESGPDGYSASDWSCDGGDLTGSNLILALGTTVTCTITNNDQQAYIIVNKTVTNDNGGTADPDDFKLTIDGNAVLDEVKYAVNPGEHTAGETTLPGYTAGAWGGDCNTNAKVTVALGETKTCTITNDDQQATITLVKEVTNDNGGSALPDDFDLTLEGSSVTSGVAVPVNPGTYTAGETNLSGYTFEGFTTDCNGDGDTTVALGEHKTCTLTNNDQQAYIIVNKTVTNDNGGTADPDDFKLTIDGNAVLDEVKYAVNPGEHTAGETTLPGYTAGAWGGDCNTNAKVTVALGETKTCTITNDDDAPSLTLVKEVVNDNSGEAEASDWTLTADPSVGTTIIGSGSVTDSDAQANTPYSLSESGPSNYHVETDWNCVGGGTFDAQANTITLTLNSDVTCTIVNDDDAHPEIKLVKTGPANAHEGDEVTYNFSVENTGDEPLSDVEIKDPLIENITYASGDTNDDQILDVDETWLFTANYVIPENQIADVYNEAEVCADPRVGEEVCDEDDHTIDVLHPAITVVKSGPLYGYEGQLVGYSFVVTNTGDTTLYGVNIVDDIATNEVCDKSTLAPNESTNCTAIYLIPIPTEENVVNNVDACGTDILQLEVCAKDDHTLDVIHPSINIIKTGPSVAHEGDEVTYTFTVTNTGDVPLSDVTVNDNIAGSATYVSGDTNDDNKLDLTETWIFTASYMIPNEQEANVDNTATACGYDPIQTQIREGAEPVCDDDDHTLDVLHPSIHVEKSGPYAANPGDTVTYTFTVTNTGDTPLSITTVNDNIAGDGVYQSGDTDSDNELDLDETWNYTAEYAIPTDQSSNIYNTVTVCGEDELKGEDCDEDDHKLVVYAKVVVTKYNDYDRDGEKDGNEPLLKDWNFCLEKQHSYYESFSISELTYEEDYPVVPLFCEDGTQETTDANGVATFANVKPYKTYILSEELEEDWHWSDTSCVYPDSQSEGRPNGENNYYVYPGPGDTIYCHVGNYRDPVLNLTKTNNRPNPTDVGDTVTYTLIASLPEDSGALNDVKVTDLPPAGFVYIPGSATSTKGSLTTPYASPGIWTLGNMLPGESVTMTYQAKISNSVSDGTYPDIAFAQGCAPQPPYRQDEVFLSAVSLDNQDSCEEIIYSNVHRVNTPFVDTKVTVSSPQVLAAVLVKTGSSMQLGYSLTAMALMLIGVATAKRRNPLKGGAK